MANALPASGDITMGEILNHCYEPLSPGSPTPQTALKADIATLKWYDQLLIQATSANYDPVANTTTLTVAVNNYFYRNTPDVDVDCTVRYRFFNGVSNVNHDVIVTVYAGQTGGSTVHTPTCTGSCNVVFYSQTLIAISPTGSGDNLATTNLDWYRGKLRRNLYIRLNT